MTPMTKPSDTLAETYCALRQTLSTPEFTLKRQANRLMAAVVAVALLAVSATPSHADKTGDTLAKALAAALVVGLVVSALNNDKKPSTPKPEPQPAPVYHPRVPAVCAIEMDSSTYGTVRMYPERCLRREGFSYRLPDCGRTVRIYGQPDQIYSAQCLREAGFGIDR